MIKLICGRNCIYDNKFINEIKVTSLTRKNNEITFDDYYIFCVYSLDIKAFIEENSAYGVFILHTSNYSDLHIKKMVEKLHFDKCYEKINYYLDCFYIFIYYDKKKKNLLFIQ